MFDRVLSALWNTEIYVLHTYISSELALNQSENVRVETVLSYDSLFIPQSLSKWLGIIYNVNININVNISPQELWPLKIFFDGYFAAVNYLTKRLPG